MSDNLPPLPKGDITYHITDSVMRQMECDAHSDRQMQAYARAAIEADRVSRDVPATQDVANLLSRFGHQWHRMGELWERFQGKGWPDKEGAEFNALRDEKAPATRAKLIAMLAASPQPQPVQAQPSEEDDYCRCEPSDWVAPSDYDGDGSVDGLARRATMQRAQPKPANQQKD